MNRAGCQSEVKIFQECTPPPTHNFDKYELNCSPPLFVFLKTICPFTHCNELLMFSNNNSPFWHSSWKTIFSVYLSLFFHKTRSCCLPEFILWLSPELHWLAFSSYKTKLHICPSPGVTRREAGIIQAIFHFPLICPLSLMESERYALRHANRLKSPGAV